MATRPKRPRDVNQLAKLIVGISTGEAEDDCERNDAAEAGSKGGKVGGPKRMSLLSAEQRKALALRAARARWSKKTD